METSLLRLFWIFLKVNLLSTSGPASVGLLYSEMVGGTMTEEEFIEAVGFSSALPGSDALQLAMFVGFAAGGFPGALVALVGSILPPTVIMLSIVLLLQRLRGEAWVTNFVHGLSPAIAVLLVMTAWKVFGEVEGLGDRVVVAIATLSLIALLLKVHPALVVLVAGLLGVVALR